MGSLRGKTVGLWTIWLGVGCTVLMAPTTVPAGQCDADVIGYWPLDGNATEQVNGFGGGLVGTVGFADGKVGQAASLGGDGSYIDAGTHAELSSFGGDEMTVAAWVLRQPWPGQVGDGLGAVITARTSCDWGNFQLYAHLFGDELYYSKWPPIDSGLFEDQVSSSYAPFPVGVWKHIAATYTSGEVRFYVDGAMVDSVAPSYGGTINDDVQNVQIGSDSCSGYWTGLLDEVIVYRTALDDEEIEALHQRGASGTSACATPDELIADLMAEVIGLNLQNGIENSLDAKLGAVLGALEDLNDQNNAAAIGSLLAFVNAVEAQRGKAIPEATADSLIASALSIIDLIGS